MNKLQPVRIVKAFGLAIGESVTWLVCTFVAQSILFPTGRIGEDYGISFLVPAIGALIAVAYAFAFPISKRLLGQRSIAAFCCMLLAIPTFFAFQIFIYQHYLSADYNSSHLHRAIEWFFGWTELRPNSADATGIFFVSVFLFSLLGCWWLLKRRSQKIYLKHSSFC